VKKVIYIFFEKLIVVFKRKNKSNCQYINSDSLDRDRLEHFLRSGRHLEGVFK